ncbi:hypothetical protein Sipo8835_00770 [Streptomyces ipomoeae]|uniref:Uncharacterized protein n=1 Tax=Streptomyces ipomoeae TaxID=103232 RepID=A0AAE8W7E6_9ACTN|nr:hypothetical protein [Streptomyces ipomoeae]TQE40029.1 hypothetical protein Sipo8835_00770 [Streptomyces ipomoeae]
MRIPPALTSLALPTVKLSAHFSLSVFSVMECLMSNVAEPTGLPFLSTSTRASTCRHMLVRVTVMVLILQLAAAAVLA